MFQLGVVFEIKYSVQPRQPKFTMRQYYDNDAITVLSQTENISNTYLISSNPPIPKHV